MKLLQKSLTPLFETQCKYET